MAVPCSCGAVCKLEAVSQSLFHSGTCVETALAASARDGNAARSPAAVKSPWPQGLWSCTRPLRALVEVCAAACPLVPQLGGGSAWPLQVQRGGDCGCICGCRSWSCSLGASQGRLARFSSWTCGGLHCPLTAVLCWQVLALSGMDGDIEGSAASLGAVWPSRAMGQLWWPRL